MQVVADKCNTEGSEAGVFSREFEGKFHVGLAAGKKIDEMNRACQGVARMFVLDVRKRSLRVEQQPSKGRQLHSDRRSLDWLKKPWELRILNGGLCVRDHIAIQVGHRPEPSGHLVWEIESVFPLNLNLLLSSFEGNGVKVSETEQFWRKIRFGPRARLRMARAEIFAHPPRQEITR
jgi:hypothetical protein